MKINFYTHRTDAMRRIILLLSRGNYRYASGREPLNSAPLLAAKHAVYGADLSNSKRYYRRKIGRATCHKIYLLDADNNRFFWWLLVDDGSGLVTENESLYDARKSKKRIKIGGYEAVRVPKKASKRAPESKRKSNTNTQWTWQISAEKYGELEAKIVHFVRQKDFGMMRQWDYSLRRSPSFRGVRAQCYKLASRAFNEWKRSARGDFPLPKFAMGWQGKYKKPNIKTLNF